MFLIRRVAAASMVPFTLLVAGCGGGGGTNSTPPPVVPPPTYSKFSELTGTQTFQTAGVTYVYDHYGLGPPPATEVGKFGNYISYIFDFTAGTITVNEPGQAAITFDEADKTLEVDDIVKYDKEVSLTLTKELVLRAPRINGVALSYTRYGSLGFNDTSELENPNYGGTEQVYGVATKSGDMPTNGSANYTASVVGGGFDSTSGGGYYGFSDSQTTVHFSANFGDGTVSTDIDLFGERFGGGEMDFGTVNGSGTIASSGPGFSGELSGGATGKFSGAFFGPQAAEMGYSFYVVNPDGSGGGTVVGTR